MRARFNPDGSLLRRHQLRMLEMLTYIDGVCVQHDIPYWLSSGTLLGAVRHGGFIPWDDDVDIELLRRDYKRLLRVLRTEKEGRYRLQTHSTDNGYFFPFAKLRDMHSVLRENDDIDLGFAYRGIYIDIFPLEVNKYPLSKALVSSAGATAVGRKQRPQSVRPCGGERAVRMRTICDLAAVQSRIRIMAPQSGKPYVRGLFL